MNGQVFKQNKEHVNYGLITAFLKCNLKWLIRSTSLSHCLKGTFLCLHVCIYTYLHIYSHTYTHFISIYANTFIHTYNYIYKTEELKVAYDRHQIHFCKLSGINLKPVANKPV